jgi:ketosteroid isomerase-like protein
MYACIPGVYQVKTAVYCAVGLFMALGAASAQTKSAAGDEAAIRAIEEKWDAASLKGDTTTLSAIFADGFMITSPEGQVRNKAQTLARVKSGEVKYQSAKADDLKIVFHGDTAVVNGRWQGKFVEKGKANDVTERFTDVFVRQNGQWRCVASHASTIK